MLKKRTMQAFERERERERESGGGGMYTMQMYYCIGSA